MSIFGSPDEASPRASRRAREDDITGWVKDTDSEEFVTWLRVTKRHLAALGLDNEDVRLMYRHLPTDTNPMITVNLIQAGRFGDIDMRWIHLWTAARIVEMTPRVKKNTEWVTTARRFIAATNGDQQLAATAAAAGLSVEETATKFRANDFNLDTLRTLIALRI